MVKFVLKEETTEKVVYEYFTENALDSGFVMYDKNEEKFLIIALAKNDYHQRYVQKVILKIRDFVTANSFQNEGIVAWY